MTEDQCDLPTCTIAQPHGLAMHGYDEKRRAERRARNMQLALEGKPHEAMSIMEVLDAMEKGESYVGEPGYDQQIVKWARLGAAVEAEHQKFVESGDEDMISYAMELQRIIEPPSEPRKSFKELAQQPTFYADEI